MSKIHNDQSIDADETYLHLVIDEKPCRIRWEDCSPGLAKANMAQRKRFDVAPSGYGIHWPEIDEDLAITPLLRHAKILTPAAEGNGTSRGPATGFNENLEWSNEEIIARKMQEAVETGRL
jgi:hypothetical protein